ncbi:cupin-like domain-containing protein [uncultured Enterovirga sp.]|uniref:cupin-like domain-containing protein n=1 Tax=uncultured Enterovirga sp. TaxID=2026352 RepID=UPI0035CAFAB4
MRPNPVFTSWPAKASALWNNQPIRLEHRLHQTPLFSREGLAELISRYPREHYSLVYMGAQGEAKRFWREGEIGSLSGAQVIDAIAQGRMWLNLRNITDVDPRYREMLDETFAELSERIPGFEAPTRSAGILISSPSAQVYYHTDLPGQCLWQISGRKRVHVYPASAPFVTPQHLEDIAVHDVEVNMPYDPWYEEHAQAYDLEPGQMLSWPLNAPHRVENLNTLNISMTVSFVTEDIRRRQMVNLANGILRHRFGVSSVGRATEGPAFWSKAVLQKVMRQTGWAKRKRREGRQIDFRLDDQRLGEIVDLKAA